MPKERTSGIQEIKCHGCGSKTKVNYVIDEFSDASTVEVICPDCDARQRIIFRRHQDLK